MSVQTNRMCYFPLDVRFFENDKIEFIMAKFGLRGVSIVIRLLCDIYANGYYIRWDDDKCRLMSRKLGARNGQFVSQVVQGLLEIGFFDAESYTKHGILTSKSAQEVYLDYVRKCKLEEIQDSDYLIIEPIQKRKHTKREKQIDEKRDSKGETNNSPYNINKIKGNKIERNIAAEAAAKSNAVGAAASATSAASDACFENLVKRPVLPTKRWQRRSSSSIPYPIPPRNWMLSVGNCLPIRHGSGRWSESAGWVARRGDGFRRCSRPSSRT